MTTNTLGDEAMDHELHRTPVTKTMKDQVIALAATRYWTQAMVIREAVRQYLEQQK